MAFSNAFFVVAFVKDPEAIRDRSAAQNPGRSMGANLFSVKTESSVMPFFDIIRPLPTSGTFPDLAFKAKEILRMLGGFHNAQPLDETRGLSKNRIPGTLTVPFVDSPIFRISVALSMTR